MLGPPKARRVDRPVLASLEALVPRDNFYRHLARVLDLRLRARPRPRPVRRRRAAEPRPVVFFQLQLILFFEGLRSERQLIATASLHLAHRWYLGYALDEPLPDHSTLSRIRQRLGLEVFRRFFEEVVERCREAGLVWGRELYIDATKVEADAAVDSLSPASSWRPTCSASSRPRPRWARRRGGAERQRAGRRAPGPGQPAAPAPAPLPTAPAAGAGGRPGAGERRAPRLARARGAPGPDGHARPLPAPGRPGGEHDRPRRDADADPGRGAPGLPDPLRRRRRARPGSSWPPWSPPPR